MGLDISCLCKLYRNTGSFGSPVWTEIPTTKDATLTITPNEADASARLDGYKRSEPTLIEVSLDFNMIVDTSVTEYAALRDGAIARTLFDIACANGGIAVTGTRYYRADLKIFDWKKGEPLAEVSTIDVKMKLAYSSHTPGWVTV